MNAGANLDIIVAQLVLHQTNFAHDEIAETSAGDPICIQCGQIGYWGDNIFGDTKCVKRYSTEIKPAFEVVEYLRDNVNLYNKRFILDVSADECYAAFMFASDGVRVPDPKAIPLVICLAALKAIGVKVE